MSDDAQIQALQREREGLVARGLKDRIRLVDAELKRLEAGDTEAAVDAAPEKAVQSRPAKRSAAKR